MEQIGLIHRPKRKPNGITKPDRKVMKAENLLKREFHSDAPLKKYITDITEIRACDGKRLSIEWLRIISLMGFNAPSANLSH